MSAVIFSFTVVNVRRMIIEDFNEDFTWNFHSCEEKKGQDRVVMYNVLLLPAP